MDSLNSGMTRDPNQTNRPSVFAFDPYQQQGRTLPWQKFENTQMAFSGSSYQNPTGNAFTPSIQIPPSQVQRPEHFQSHQFLGNFSPPSTSSVVSNYGSPCPIPGSFSFGSPESRPTSFPVQFPFPTNPASSPPTPGVSGVHLMSPSTSKGVFGRNVADLSSNQSAVGQNPSARTITRPGFGFAQPGSTSMFTMQYRGKRKNDDPTLQPVKQHITEEMMTEHMSKLHISSETAVPDETETTKEKRLYMCAEMRKLQNDSILPQSLLNTINRPCTALVLWTPPPRIFPPLSSSTDENENDPSDEMDSQYTVADKMPLEPGPEEIELETESGALSNEMEFDL